MKMSKRIEKIASILNVNMLYTRKEQDLYDRSAIL